mgnify:CR=1 FL=1
MKIKISKIINKIQNINCLEDLLSSLRLYDWSDKKRLEEIISKTDDDFNTPIFYELDPNEVQNYANMLLQAIDDEFHTEFRHFLLSDEYVKNRVVKKMGIKWDWEY